MENTVIKNTRVMDCRIKTEDSHSDSAFGAGHAWNNVRVLNTTVVNSELHVNDRNSLSGIGVGLRWNSPDSERSMACNTTINDQYITTDCDRIDLSEMNTLIPPETFETTQRCPLNNSQTTMEVSMSQISPPTQTTSSASTTIKTKAPEITTARTTVETAFTTMENTPMENTPTENTPMESTPPLPPG
ncbi:hypothetical protein [Endozoicomonas sp. YOMI1]|uniref:hypothetical protein n=1 Tax=Endozoicomonas sp. YOMI1 TaxID=2828739 RepID=UPI002147EBAA|nr:hypothetical protein [Endozoicomonas sp. YOMI1]